MTRKNGWYYSPSEQGFFRPDVHGEAVPADSIAISNDLYEELLQGNNTEGKRIMPPDESHALPWLADPLPPTPEQQQAAVALAIQGRLDAFALTRGYDSALACASYATSSNPRYASEGQYMAQARDATWAKYYEILDAVLSGERPLPTLEEVFAELPELSWPDEGGTQ